MFSMHSVHDDDDGENIFVNLMNNKENAEKEKNNYGH